MASNTAKTSRFMNFLAYVAIIFVGIALIISLIFNWADGSAEVARAFEIIANLLAYIAVGFYSYFYARSKRNIWFLIAWVVAVVLIIVFFVFAAIG